MSFKLLFIAVFIAVASAQLPDLSGVTGGLPDTSGLTGGLPVPLPVGGGSGSEEGEQGGAAPAAEAFNMLANRFSGLRKNKN